MLTEADMIRIMAEKYSLAESIAEAGIDIEARRLLSIDELFEIHSYDFASTEVSD